MYYNIAGHVISISGERLANTPSFSPFISASSDSVLDIKLNVRLDQIKGFLKYHFSSDLFDCDFWVDITDYYLRFQKDGKIWLMKVYSVQDKFFAITDITENTNIHIINFAIWIAFGLSMISRNTVSVHASAIVREGRAILFLGESGTGKSTQSRLWLQHISSIELINDDSPFVQIGKSSTPTLWGSPWSGKIDCYKNVNTEIAAFIRLTQAPENKIKRLSVLESIAALQPSLPPIFAIDSFLSVNMYKCLASMVEHIPVYSLNCLPDRGAVDLTFSTLCKDKCL